MFLFRSALAIAFGFAAPAAWAEMITPDSIPNPPGAVGSANGTSVYASNLVTIQYAGLGLNFSSGAAITTVNGVSVWAPTEMLAQPDIRISGGPQPSFPAAQINYYGSWSGLSFVQPGTLTPTTAQSVSLEILGWPVDVWVRYANGSVVMPALTDIDGNQLTTFPVGPGITSVFMYEPPLDSSGGAQPINPAWGVAYVSVTLAPTPEPSSLLLAALGALGLAACLGSRRRMAACPAHA
jgi:hypothetical protein